MHARDLSDRSRVALVVLALVGVTTAIYLRVGWHDFVNYDDNDYVTANAQVQAGLTWNGIVWAFSRLHGERTYWHPVVWLSHMLDCQLFGLRAGAPHLVSVGLHVVNALMLFFLLRRMTGALWRSAVVAALFAWHPLQVDTVAWVAERKNLVSTFFWLATCAAYVRYAARPNVTSFWPVPLLFALALMAKPTTITLPCVLLLLDVWPMRRFEWTRQRSGSAAASEQLPVFPARPVRLLLLEKLPLVPLMVAAAWLLLASHAGLGIDPSKHGLSLGLRLENAVVSYAHYLQMFFWPAGLCVLHPHPGSWPGATVALSALALLAVSLAAVWRWHAAPWLAVGWCWFLGVLVPMLGLVQIGVQALAERFMYVPLIGLALALVWDLGRWAEHRSGWRRPIVAGTMALLATCAVLSFLQLRYWKNSLSLYERAVAVTRGNFVAEGNLAYTLFLAGRPADAREHATESLRIRPDYWQAALTRAMSYQQEARFDLAIADYQAVLAHAPENPLAMRGLARSLLATGQPAGARTLLQVLAERSPNDADLEAELASASEACGDMAEAISRYRAALRLRPDWPDVLNNLAWALATNAADDSRDGAEAIRLAQRACELTRRTEPQFLGTLAAAYAESGHFDDAIRTAEAARSLALAAGNQQLADANARLLDGYRRHQPVRQSPPQRP